MQRVGHSLALRIALPVTVLALVLGASLYFFVLSTISRFAQNEIERDLKSLSHRVYNICNINFDDILHTGQTDDRGTLIIKQALTLGQFEDFFRQESLEGLVFSQQNGELLLATNLPMNPEKIIAESKSEGKVISLGTEAEGHFAYHFDFSPWDWHILIIKSKQEYSDLITQVQHVHFYTLGLLILATFSLVFFLYQSIKRPVDAIIAPIKKGQRPKYKGIDVFNFLSDTIANMMDSLQQSEEKYRLLIDNLPNIVFKGYKDGSIDFMDDKIERLTGYKKNDFNSRRINWLDIVVEEDKEKMRQTFITALKTDKSYVREYRIKTKTEIILWIQEGSQIVCNESGEIEYIGGAFLDISRHKKLEIQLQQLDRIESIGTLAGGVAHDFNNLLMGIQGRTSLMMMDSDTSPSHFEHLKGIEDYVKSAADLTRQLLGFARGGKYEVKPTELNALIKIENRMFGRTRKEINIQEKFEQNLWTVEVDRRQIEQVLLNIYVNAWQAMPGGGDLYIQTENIIIDEEYSKPYRVDPGNYVKVSITDTGVGMDEATQQRIFDPFFTTKEMGRGTGLGLASAYGIIKNHNGFINVYSEKGGGTTFNIYLPASEKEAVKEEELNEKLSRGTETLLFVDDEEMIVDVGCGIIEKLGYKVLTAKSGKEAIEIYEKNRGRIDMVILDMIMPDMGGGETYDKLKEINPDIKVLLSSGYSINGRATEILERGCNGFIQKPFNIADLSKKIREILDKD